MTEKFAQTIMVNELDEHGIPLARREGIEQTPVEPQKRRINPWLVTAWIINFFLVAFAAVCLWGAFVHGARLYAPEISGTSGEVPSFERYLMVFSELAAPVIPAASLSVLGTILVQSVKWSRLER